MITNHDTSETEFATMVGVHLICRRASSVSKPRLMLSSEPGQRGPTAAQLASRFEFMRASHYAKVVREDPAALAVYTAIAQRNKRSAYAEAFRDYMNPPMVESIDLTAYNGCAGDRVAIIATDAHEVTAVSVTIRDAANVMIFEQGAAARGDPDWIYTATTHLPPNQEITIEVTALDRPGHEGVQTKTFTRVL